jgi:hypothetical protein
MIQAARKSIREKWGRAGSKSKTFNAEGRGTTISGKNGATEEMKTENISRFLERNYSDEQLAALLAHAESGRLSYNSCCCLVGIPLATHALRGEHEYDFEGEMHLDRGRELPWAKEAELEFALLGPDRTRRRILMPLVLAEMERRERKKSGDPVLRDPVIG